MIMNRCKDIWMLALGPLASEFTEKEMSAIATSMEEVGILLRNNR